MHVTLCTCVLVPGETVDNASSGAGAMDRRQPSHMGTGTELKSSGGTLPQSSSAFHPDCLSVNQIPTARPAPQTHPLPMPLTSAGTLPALPGSSVPSSPQTPD